MNRAEQILLQAIQKSIWNTDITFPDDADWNAVFKEAEEQAVLGIVIGVAPAEAQEKWPGRASAGIAHFVRILHCQEQLYKLLKENGIPMVILKGTAAAIYYPNPSQRSMGDIDYLVPPEHFERAKELLAQNGYSIDDDPKYPRHIHVSKDHVSFEQHRFFSSEVIDIEEYVTDGLSHADTKCIYGIEFPLLPGLANGLVLLGHMVHHLKAGLGLRQVIDWMMYVNRELSDAFWARSFGAAAKAVGLDTVAIVTTRMCQMYLGLSQEIGWCREADAQLCSELMENLLSSGNFDRKRGQGSKIETVTSRMAREGLFRSLQKAGENNWKADHRHPWLKPFAWLYQSGRYIRQGLQVRRRGTRVIENIGRGKQRNDLFQKLRVGQIQQ